MAENTSAITLEMIGINKAKMDSLNNYLSTGLLLNANAACIQWVEIGKIIHRIKAAKRTHRIKGKLNDLIRDFFQHKLTKDEIACSQKMADHEKEIVIWHKSEGCKRSTPRAIWGEYNKQDKEKKETTPYERCQKVIKTMGNTIEKNIDGLSPEERDSILYEMDEMIKEARMTIAERKAAIIAAYKEEKAAEKRKEEALKKIAAMADKTPESEAVEELAKTG